MSHLLEIDLAALPALNYLKAAITNGQTLTGTYTDVKLAFDPPSFNDCFAESSDVFTCTKAGFYYVGLAAYDASSRVQSIIYHKNGSVGTLYHQWGTLYFSGTHTDFVKLLRLEVGDTLEFRAYISANVASLFGGDELRTLKMVRITG